LIGCVDKQYGTSEPDGTRYDYGTIRGTSGTHGTSVLRYINQYTGILKVLIQCFIKFPIIFRSQHFKGSGYSLFFAWYLGLRAMLDQTDGAQ